VLLIFSIRLNLFIYIKKIKKGTVSYRHEVNFGSSS